MSGVGVQGLKSKVEGVGVRLIFENRFLEGEGGEWAEVGGGLRFARTNKLDGAIISLWIFV